MLFLFYQSQPLTRLSGTTGYIATTMRATGKTRCNLVCKSVKGSNVIARHVVVEHRCDRCGATAWMADGEEVEHVCAPRATGCPDILEITESIRQKKAEVDRARELILRCLQSLRTGQPVPSLA